MRTHNYLDLLRESGVKIFTYSSARNIDGINVGIFSTEAFSANKPVSGKDKHWSVYISKESIEFKQENFSNSKKELHIFKLEDFYTSGEFPVAM